MCYMDDLGDHAGKRRPLVTALSLGKLRIAQIAPPGIPCPPNGYGASELITSNLTEELVRQGHEVTLFAHPDSYTRAELVSFPRVYDLNDAGWREVAHVSLALDRADEFDIIHSHCIAPGPALTRLAAPVSLTTLHYIRPLVHTFASAAYVAVSFSQACLLRDGLNIVGVAPNGIDMRIFPLVESKSDYLLFLGRIDPKKGVHLAIDVAEQLDARLLIAASYPTRDNREYFERAVKPRLGGKIEYVGHAGTREKTELLGRARCVLTPQQWEEPFGLVAVEALASGTTVVALRRAAGDCGPRRGRLRSRQGRRHGRGGRPRPTHPSDSLPALRGDQVFRRGDGRRLSLCLSTLTL